MKTYETRPGDTPLVIAKEQLGDRDLWADIVVLNADKCGFMGPHDWYRVGTFLRLPEGAMSAIDHDEIYLQPVCCVNDDIGRLWCEDADPEDCEDGKHWTRYVRADIHESAISELEALRQERDGLLKRVAHLEALKVAAIRVVGEHSEPNDCYATGPLTGDPFLDFVECPSCTFLKLVNNTGEYMAKEQGDGN